MDFAELDPVTAQGLQTLLNYEGADVEDVFGLVFEITQEVFGEIKHYPLKPNGPNIPVTDKNK